MLTRHTCCISKDLGVTISVTIGVIIGVTIGITILRQLGVLQFEVLQIRLLAFIIIFQNLSGKDSLENLHVTGSIAHARIVWLADSGRDGIGSSVGTLASTSD